MKSDETLLTIVKAVRKGNIAAPKMEIEAKTIDKVSCRTILRHFPEKIEDIPLFYDKHVNTAKWLNELLMLDNWTDVFAHHLCLNRSSVCN